MSISLLSVLLKIACLSLDRPFLFTKDTFRTVKNKNGMINLKKIDKKSSSETVIDTTVHYLHNESEMLVVVLMVHFRRQISSICCDAYFK